MKQRQQLRLAGLGSLFWLMAGNVAAANPNSDDSPPSIPVTSPNMTGSLLWVVFALFIVIVLIVIVIKWLSQRNRSWGTNRSLRSLGGIPLGQNKSLQVIELSGRIYVVGVGENISLLDKIDDPEDAQAVLDQLEQQSGTSWSTTSLKRTFARLRGQTSDSEKATERWQEADSFKSMLQDRMNRQSDRKRKVEDLLKEQNQNDRLLDE